LHTRIADALERVLGLRVEVKLVEPLTLKRSEGKAMRVIDRRSSS
jgi:phenylacetate-CoA ligase